MSLSTRILLAMFSGGVLGWILGYALPAVDTLGKGFVMLLQMTAIPYVAVSLIYGIGLMTKSQGKQLLRYGVAIFMSLIAVVMVMILLGPLAFPDWTSASFYSASIVALSEPVDMMALFIPANPFAAFANAKVPAIVLFCMFLGVGFMSVRHRKLSLHLLRDIQHSIANVNGYIMRLAPIGVFCIAQNAAGTLDAQQIDGLTVYVITAAVVTFILTFVVLPGIVVILTPFNLKDVLWASRNAMVTAFATGNLFIVLPIIAERIHGLFRGYVEENDPAHNIPEIVVPISYSLPTGGKLLAILFVIFAGWFNGEDIASSDYPLLSAAGFAYLFGSAYAAVPQLLAMFDISAGMFDLFMVADNLIVSRLGALLAAMFCTVLTILVSTSILKLWQTKLRRLLRFLLIVPAVSALLLFALGKGFDAMTHQYQGYAKFIERDLLLPAAEYEVLTEPSKQFDARIASMATLDRIKARGLIRMGYYWDALPYAFHNSEGELVGLDVELVHLLARELNVKVEFVKVLHNQIEPLLESGYLDIASGIPLIPENMVRYTLTTPYTEERVAVIVKDERRQEFRSWKAILARDDLLLGVPESMFYQEGIRRNFDKMEVWELSTPRIFFRDQDRGIDGMLFGAARASAWSLVYPEFGVVVPQPALASMSIAFPISRHDYEFELFMRNWITMKTDNQTIERLFRYWIEGESKASIGLELAPGERSSGAD